MEKYAVEADNPIEKIARERAETAAKAAQGAKHVTQDEGREQPEETERKKGAAKAVGTRRK